MTPIYPPDLLAIGTEGMVQATYVVDTVGQVDATTIKVVQSDDPPLHHLGVDGAGADALPAGQARGQDGAAVGGAEVPVQDRPASDLVERIS